MLDMEWKPLWRKWRQCALTTIIVGFVHCVHIHIHTFYGGWCSSSERWLYIYNRLLYFHIYLFFRFYLFVCFYSIIIIIFFFTSKMAWFLLDIAQAQVDEKCLVSVVVVVVLLLVWIFLFLLIQLVLLFDLH